MLLILLVVSQRRPGRLDLTRHLGRERRASSALLAAFIWWELRVSSPILDLRLFKRKLVALGVAAGWISFLGSSAARFLMPFYLQRVLLYSPKEVGLIMIPAAICMVVVGPVSGRLSDKFGWRILDRGRPFASSRRLVGAGHQPVPGIRRWALIIAMLMLHSTGAGLFYTPNR